MGHTDFEDMDRRVFDKVSRRILVKVNPRKEYIPNRLALEKRMIRIMAENQEYKLLGALKTRYAKRAIERAIEGDRLHRIWLGWIKLELPKIRGKRKKRKKRRRSLRRF